MKNKKNNKKDTEVEEVKKIGFFKRLRRRLYKLIMFFLAPVFRVLKVIAEKVEESIRFELIVIFGVCFAFSLIVFALANDYFSKENKVANIDYDTGIESIYRSADMLLEDLSVRNPDVKDSKAIEDIFNERSSYNYTDGKFIITDLEGKILFKTSTVSETEIDIYSLIKNSNNLGQSKSSVRQGKQEKTKEVTVFYPVKLKDTRAYMIIKGIPEARIIYDQYTSKNQPLALLIALMAFILSFIFITNRKMKYVGSISKGVSEISKGNLSFRINKIGKDELSNLAVNINYMAEEIENKIEAERRAEKTKSELITNVSHDLRTPLTSVMGYIGLVKEGKYDSEEKMKEYLDIAFNKAEKLKMLIEDLFEYTKLTNEGVKLYKNNINLNEFIDQVINEMIPICDENNLEIKSYLPLDKIHVDIDANKMVRVLENLIGNAIKYSYKPGVIEVYLSLDKEKGEAMICVQNRGDNIPNDKLNKLFDRFYRMDESRNASTGGSGLGLAIAKSIVELHKGNIFAECEDNIIRFYVTLIVNNE